MRCATHPFDRASDVCAHCGENHCPHCLLFPMGPKRPPVCKECAIIMSGARRGRIGSPISKGELRKRRSELAELLAGEPLGMFRYTDMVPIADLQPDPDLMPTPRNLHRIDWMA
jgi:hypothetical protein